MDITGTEGHDVLEGTVDDDTITALGGSDTIFLSAGNDYVDGGEEDISDLLIAFMFDLSLFPDPMEPRSYTVSFDQVSDTSGALNTIFIGIEQVRISTINSGDFDDTFDASGFAGANGVMFDSGHGDDTMIGSPANDFFSPGFGANVVDGGAGVDLAQVSVDTRIDETVQVIASVAGILFVAGDGTDAYTNIESFWVVTGFSDTALKVDASAVAVEIQFDLTGLDDVLIGGDADDLFYSWNLVVGSTGASLTGNGGADSFRFARFSAGFDGTTITDLESADLIDLASVEFNDTFTPMFIGSSSFSGIAGEYRYVAAGGQTLIEVDTDGDAASDKVLTVANGEFVLAETGPGSNILQRVEAPGVIITGTSADDTIDSANTVAGQPFPSLGPDVIFGRGGHDRINGLDGNDVILGGPGWDILFGAGGDDILVGGAGRDTLLGGLGSDRLMGGSGMDVLVGGLGGDRFMLASVGATSADVFVDFAPDMDVIEVSGSSYGLAPGALDPSLFVVGPEAVDPHAQFVYHSDAQQLMWDPDGLGGSAGVTVASFSTAIALTASDFLVI
jgi:Ca2+-binding RTX toxin-like protein